MTIGILQIQGLLIQAVGLVYQAATAIPVFSAAVGTSATGGLLQSLVPTLGYVVCTTTATMSTETASFTTTATQLAASGIKNFKL